MHSTFILLFLAIAVFLAILDPANLVPVLVLFVMLFVSVFVHELFHSIVAVAKGCGVERIVLLPIGGVSMTSELPENPWDEFLIAIAGPVFNFAIVLIIVIMVAVFPSIPWPWQLTSPFAGVEMLEAAILQYPLFGLFYVNLILGAFNLFVPALPLDGGRVLRAALAGFLGFGRATHLATRISTFLAIAMLITGFFFNWVLMIIALFIFMGANAEEHAVWIKQALHGVPVRAALNTRPFVLLAELSIEDAIGQMELRNKDSALVLLGKGYGCVDVELLARVPKAEWDSRGVEDVAKHVQAVDADADAGKVLTAMLAKGISLMPVVEGHSLLGTVEESDINKLYRIHRLHKG